jgi:hypothetical protein
VSETPLPADLGPPRGRRTIWLTVMSLLLVAIAGYGVVARERLAAGAPDTAATAGDLIRPSQARGTSLAAIGRVEGLAEPCTAWLLDVGDAGGQPAYAVTAGRCVGIDDTATVVSEARVEGASVEFGTYAAVTAASRVDPVRVAVAAVTWASMRGSDLAVLRLGSSYDELAAAGIRPVSAGQPLDPEGQVLVAGVPVEGLPDGQRHLRGTRCAVGSTADVLEAPWLWTGAQSSDCTGILPGSAGSPALDGSGRAVGMVSTSTISSDQLRDCYEGRPCVVDAEGETVEPDATYLVDVAGVPECFPGGVFRLGAECPLEDPAGVVGATPQSSTARPLGEVRIAVADQSAGAVVGVRVGAVGVVECDEPVGWRPTVVSGGTIAVTMPVVSGFALVCVGRPAQPTRIVIEADSAAPDSGLVGLDQRAVAGGVEVRPTSESPALTQFLWVAGPTGSIDCETAEGYVEYRDEPALIEVADLPTTVCVVGIDSAGTATAPVAIEVSLPGE